MQFFSWRRPFQTKLLFFQTIESTKCTFAAVPGSGKPTFLHASFLENEKQNSRKNYMASISIKSKVTCKNLAHLEAKKYQPKSHVGYSCVHPFKCSFFVSKFVNNYSGTPLYGHLLNKDTRILWTILFVPIKTSIFSLKLTCLIWTLV